MDMVNEFLGTPSVRYLQAAPYLVYFMLLVHLPYMGMVLVSPLLSLVHHRRNPGLSRFFTEVGGGNPLLWTGLGLLPPLGLAFLLGAMQSNTPIAIHHYLLRIFPLALAGFVLLTLYRRSLRTGPGPAGVLAGAAGAGATGLYCFLLVNLLSLLIFPEKWPFLDPASALPYPLFSITPLLHFGIFLGMAVIMTGAGILLIHFQWPDRRLEPGNPHGPSLKYHGFGLMLLGVLLIPPLLFIDLYTLPGFALSLPVFGLSGLLLPVLVTIAAATAVMIRAMIRERGAAPPRFGVLCFVSSLLLFGLFTARDQLLRANAGLESTAVLMSDAQKREKTVLGEREATYTKVMEPDPVLGEQLYNERCTSCHAFDQRKMGPPMNGVLPKYRGKPDELAAFLEKPRKVDPTYPAMPAPGLTGHEIRSTVQFLLNRLEAGAGGKNE